MKINKYPDGTSYINDVNTLGHEFIYRINNYENLWQLNQLIDAYHSNRSVTPTIIIPNLIDAQADKRFNIGESSGLKLVCKFLNEMKANFKIFHPHNPEIVEALMDNVEIIDNSKFIEEVLYSGIPINITTMKHSNLILMSADAGGFKPLMKLCDNIKWKGETFSASKARLSKGMVQIIGCEDFNGKDILIIDDISIYGGTFKGLAKMLKKRNCGRLYLAVSHMTVQNLGDDPVTNYFDKVFTTNSKFDNYTNNTGFEEGRSDTSQPVNLEIIKLF